MQFVGRSAVQQWKLLLMRCIDREKWKKALHKVDIKDLPMSLYEVVCQLCILAAHDEALSPPSSR